ncbi:hypothetical protein GGR44_000574 [Sphingobium fontiphilum]|uniref:DUF4136 domain-containing protein n=1 Tax=Sphingobium fontiphilum TaxID=944425 RepID=A0A7W6GN51_9SPHN|nr:hypothetical protein [Sphingobium fontiphilum]MBB3980943.1 hypothetical protein [Sphingobium fontiphilum]
MLARYLAAFALLWSLGAVQAYGQEKGAVLEGFSAASLQGQKILLFRPSVWVGEQSTAGMPEPNADWTTQSRDLLAQELGRRQADFSNQIISEPDLQGEDAQLLTANHALFNTVARSVVTYQFFVGNRLPTRKNKAFDWTLGQQTQRIAALTGARYGLFVTVHDEYGSLGRKMFQIFAAGIAGVGVKSGVHRGYAGLVDLESGQLVWLNADEAMGGDVRTAEGMQKRVAQLLEDFPGMVVKAAP